MLLVRCSIPGIGTTVGGARRWIRFPGFSLQPAEIAKFAWVVYLAYSLAKKREKVATFSMGFLPHLLLAGLLVRAVHGRAGLRQLAWRCSSCSSSCSSPRGRSSSYLVGSVLLALPLAYAAIAHSPVPA